MSEDSKKAGEEEKALKARLEALSGALEKRQHDQADRVDAEVANLKTGRAMSLGFRVLSEFVAGIGVGALMGWQLDEWLGTKPVILIVMTMLGTIAGFWNVYRLAAAPTGTQPRNGKHSG